MQSGSGLFRIDMSEMKVMETQHYTDGSLNHLNYGVDLLYLIDKKDKCGIEFHMISCSFYDNIVETWSKEFSTTSISS
jgi:hypothetical protein